MFSVSLNVDIITIFILTKMFVKLLCLFKVQEKYCSAFLLTRLDVFGAIKSTTTIKKKKCLKNTAFADLMLRV